MPLGRVRRLLSLAVGGLLVVGTVGGLLSLGRVRRLLSLAVGGLLVVGRVRRLLSLGSAVRGLLPGVRGRLSGPGRGLLAVRVLGR
ncbi:hypothetical protein HS048_05060 [Planomonospora sp. ID91781]|uniref:hypothetical protein n=1 Tax=Planomonospora sp. ID91781 TaxID=2738135 RepID=UPI0018C3F4C7|nr:hypothetical protein [Planomonospora sp. ID91781]MBG0820107.1 hypothetical protein [Planomonospora sp. ID91781]